MRESSSSEALQEENQGEVVIAVVPVESASPDEGTGVAADVEEAGTGRVRTARS